MLLMSYNQDLLKAALLKELFRNESDPIVKAVSDEAIRILSYGMKPGSCISTDGGMRINPATGEIMQ